jgi:mannosyltransferase OCH1-like enzyme
MGVTRKNIQKRIGIHRKTRSAQIKPLIIGKKETATIETQTDWNTYTPLNTTVWPIQIDETKDCIDFPEHVPKRQHAQITNNIYNIPLKLFQTWNTTSLPRQMAKNVIRLLTTNPEFDYYLYDDKKSRDFILKNFGEEVVSAYDTLVPGAYKSDLWRYCVLYIHGGFYLDIKFHSIAPLISILEYGPTIFVKDRSTHNSSKDDLYNAFMGSAPRNEVFKHCINDIIFSCKFKLYQRSMLDITGPGLLGRMVMKHYPELYDSYIKDFRLDGDNIMKGPFVVFAQYPEYRADQRQFQSTPHYGGLYFARQVFR